MTPKRPNCSLLLINRSQSPCNQATLSIVFRTFKMEASMKMLLHGQLAVLTTNMLASQNVYDLYPDNKSPHWMHIRRRRSKRLHRLLRDIAHRRQILVLHLLTFFSYNSTPSYRVWKYQRKNNLWIEALNTWN